jgi:uncharacterized protein
VKTPFLPLDQFVLKVHSRCDLACDHCYVYEAADQGWRMQPKAMPGDVLRQAARRIAEHAVEHDLASVQVVLHGGEPLLAGVDGLRRIITELHSALRGVCELDLRIHTNGVQLTEAFCELFEQYGVRVGISIDGDRAANDRHRRYANGRSSYDRVVRAISLLRTDRFRSLYAGLLCTIDVANDPLAVYEALIALEPPRVDFLLPHATWEEPPPRPEGRDEQYADWLIAIFDRWLADGRPTRIRTFESILSTSTGGDSDTEALGLAPTTLAVIETDGSYEQVDSLKVAYDGAAGTELSVFSDALDVVARHSGIVARQQGLAGLAQKCRECPVVTSCGGGLYAHRYRSGTGFANPSVYCADLLKLITNVRHRLPRVSANHEMLDADFRELASGHGSAAAVRQLIDGQRTLRRTLLMAVYQAANAHVDVGDAARTGLRAAWSVLVAVDTERPDALLAVLDHSFVRSWAVRCLDQLRAPQSGRSDSRARALEADLGYLHALAAAAAVRAGVAAKVSVPVVNGVMALPTLGRLVLGPGHAEPTTAGLTVDRDAVQIHIGGDWWKLTADDMNRSSVDPILVGDHGRGVEWQATRTLRAAGLTVALEDGDPYRDCFGLTVASRLSSEQFARWQQDFEGAWAEIETRYPAFAPAIGSGLMVLVPLASGSEPPDAVITERHAFGAVAASRSVDPDRLARLIVAAFQRAKFGAITDFFDLYDPAAPDAGSVAGLLEGTYVTLADDAGPQAGGAIAALADRNVLTSQGRRFVAEMVRSLRTLLPVCLNGPLFASVSIVDSGIEVLQ